MKIICFLAFEKSAIFLSYLCYADKTMITLGIETSCDETALCLLETRGEPTNQSSALGQPLDLEYRVLAHIVHSQIDIHSKYGGVFPMMAKREHAKRLAPLLEQTITESKIGTKIFEATTAALENVQKICGEHDEELYQSIAHSTLIKEKPAIDRIAVTFGPGLEPALWVGINFANALTALWNVPVVGVNHMEGHIVAGLLPKTETKYAFEKLIDCHFPAIAFLASGGHTEIIYIKEIGDYKILGATRDDAIGEAFDKVARMLELPYPGGPKISRLAEKERSTPTPKLRSAIKEAKRKEEGINLPRPMIDSDNLDMSFAGLKTAVLYELRKHDVIDESLKKEMAREFEDAVTDVIVSKLERAFDEHEANTLIVGGGVFANKHILSACKALADRRGLAFLPPAPGLSGDNALMIAMASALSKNDHTETTTKSLLSATGNLKLQ